MQNFTNQEDQIRLDRFIRRHFPNFPQSQLEKALRAGQIKVNQKKAKSNDRINNGDEVTFYKNFDDFTVPEPFVVSKEDRLFLERHIIFEDDEICVFNKPAGLAVQGGTGTLRHVDGLFQGYKKGVSYKLTHRLDRETSGVLVLAKTPQMATYLTSLFKSKDIEKVYRAVVHGHIAHADGVIDAPLKKDDFIDFEKIVVADDGKSAVTEFKVIDYYDRYTLVELYPLTGRTHQLRVHMNHIGHSIVGDLKYGGQKSERLCLHAQSLTFVYHKKTVTFRAELMQEGLFREFL